MHDYVYACHSASARDAQGYDIAPHGNQMPARAGEASARGAEGQPRGKHKTLTTSATERQPLRMHKDNCKSCPKASRTDRNGSREGCR